MFLNVGAQLMISLENAWLVSSLKQHSQELHNKNEALKEMDRRKDEFLGIFLSIFFLIKKSGDKSRVSNPAQWSHWYDFSRFCAH